MRSTTSAVMTSTLSGFLAICISSGPRRGAAQAQNTGAQSASQAGSPKCETTGQREITITCTYTAAPRPASKAADAPRIVLNRAVLSLEPRDESHMLVELNFTNDSTEQISDRRTLYLSIDDNHGLNSVRRPLPNFDFSKLKPGDPQTFSTHLLIGAFRPGQYTISLWIPDTDPSLKFSPAHNFLLSNVGVADPVTGLNSLAHFTVDASKPRK